MMNPPPLSEGECRKLEAICHCVLCGERHGRKVVCRAEKISDAQDTLATNDYDDPTRLAHHERWPATYDTRITNGFDLLDDEPGKHREGQKMLWWW